MGKITSTSYFGAQNSTVIFAPSVCGLQDQLSYLEKLLFYIYLMVVSNRLVAKTTQLEGEKMQKEAEVQKLMEENVRLSALLDKKEAQLLAMNEQCKVMALSVSNV